jgi:hypothetical protein
LELPRLELLHGAEAPTATSTRIELLDQLDLALLSQMFERK